jgi:hypothetical protein
MRVGVDLDGVCYDFAGGLRRYLGLSLEEAPEPTRWEFYEDWGLALDDFLIHCHAGVNAGWLFWVGDPFPGTREALVRLRNAGHTIVIITDRFFGDTGASERATRQWLDNHDLPYDEIHFTSDKTTVSVDYMVDDKFSNYEAMFNSGVRSYLLDRPWNYEYAAALHRLSSLSEYVDIVLSGEVTVTSATGGQKGKKLARYDLLPAGALRQVAELYGRGAEKYDDNNWRKGYDWSLSFAALNRHLWQFWEGEEYDSETGCAHMASVAFHALALLTFMDEQRGYDDRFSTKRSEASNPPVEASGPPCPCQAVYGGPTASEDPLEVTRYALMSCWRCQSGSCKGHPLPPAIN